VVVRVDGLVLAGSGADTVLTDRTCEGKAIVVVAAHNVTVRDLVLARARVPDGNGAGLRAEGRQLLVERVHFENNQVGLLAGDQPGGLLRIEASSLASGVPSVPAGVPAT